MRVVNSLGKQGGTIDGPIPSFLSMDRKECCPGQTMKPIPARSSRSLSISPFLSFTRGTSSPARSFSPDGCTSKSEYHSGRGTCPSGQSDWGSASHTCGSCFPGPRRWSSCSRSASCTAEVSLFYGRIFLSEQSFRRQAV